MIFHLVDSLFVMFEQVQAKPLAELVSERLRQSIISGHLKPGERLVERRLAAALGTSQPTVREALRSLERLGFVRKMHNKGTYVIQLDRQDFRKILEVRMPLEVLAVRRAAAKVTPQATWALREILRQMTKAAKSEDRARFHEADIAFHQKVWELAGNEYLEAALKQTIFSMFAFVLRSQGRADFLAAVKQHEQIFEGIASGNPQLAGEQFMESTLGFWKEFHQVEMEMELLFQGGRK